MRHSAANAAAEPAATPHAIVFLSMTIRFRKRETGRGSWIAAAPAGAKAESLEELYEKVKKEGAQLTLYIALSARTEEIILPIFKKRFPAL